MKTKIRILLGLLAISIGFSVVGFCDLSDEHQAKKIEVVFDGAQLPTQDSPVLVVGSEVVPVVDEGPGVSPHMLQRNRELFF